MKKTLFDVLSEAYGNRKPWEEVESVFKSENLEMNMNDFYDPFKNLVITILSQNTSDKNSTRAYIGLSKKFDIAPHILAKIDEKEIRDAIKSGGLYNIKAKRIKMLAKTVLEEFDGELNELLKLPKEEIKKRLLKIDGIGNKTADVFLANCGGYDVIAIDTNIARVVKRLGLVSSRANYERMQKALEKVIPPKKRVRAHELLIRLGRDYCKPRNPKCLECPLKSICEYKKHFMNKR